jgi:nicotinate phosphoribosyltransferase
VEVSFLPEDASSPISEGALEITIAGPWHSTILWEVPLMAIVSEIYFLQQDTDWSMDGQGGTAAFLKYNAILNML